MGAAIKNLLLAILACAFCFGGAWIYIRNSSLANPVRRPHDHPFLKTEFPAVVAYGPTVETTGDLEAWSHLQKDVILWIPVSLSPEGTLEVKQADRSTSPLADVMRKLPTRRLILNFLEDRPGTVPRVLEVIEQTGAADRILIQSGIDGLLRDLRKERPRWLFGTSRALTTRLQMMSSIGLESAVPIEGDILVLEHPAKTAGMPPKEIIAEAHRRRLRVIAGPVGTPEELQFLLHLGVDAPMTTSPESASSTLGANR